MSTANEERKPAPRDTASPKTDRIAETFEGQVVSLAGDRLVMKNKDGKECSHTLAKDAKLTCDGDTCRTEALKPGRQIRVTTKKGDRNIAAGVECLNKQATFAQPCS